VYVLRANTGAQMQHVLASIFPKAQPQLSTFEDEEEGADELIPQVRSSKRPAEDPMVRAIRETEEAIASVLAGGALVALAPQDPSIRRVQHQLAERYNVASRSRGREPYRHVEVYSGGVR
ncbi:MAG: R3H domain-containing nucleic acid-binding protein, partial [Chloroflexota bacterium]